MAQKLISLLRPAVRASLAAAKACWERLRHRRGDADAILLETLMAWLKALSHREERRLLERHRELLGSQAQILLKQLLSVVEQRAQDRWQAVSDFAVRAGKMGSSPLDQERERALRKQAWDAAALVRDVRAHLRILQDIRARGGGIQAIREGYVNARGGFALDLPRWLQQVEREHARLAQQRRPDQTVESRALLWHKALKRANTRSSLEPEVHAEIWARLWDALSDRVDAHRRDAQEEGIAALTAAQQIYTRDRYPIQWAGRNINLGLTYAERLEGSRQENVETAITYLREALQVFDPLAFPLDYALAQNNLGNIYNERLKGSRRENLESAIASYREALKVYTAEEFPLDYAMLQNNLGTAYRSRLEGERRENLERAIACFREALQVYTPDELPLQYAQTQINLGNAYVDRVQGDYLENLQAALQSYEESLRIHTLDEFPLDYALLQHNLGSVYRQLGAENRFRLGVNRNEYLERATSCFQEALRVRTAGSHPLLYAQTKNALGATYVERLSGGRRENLETAITCFQQALAVYTAEDFPLDHRDTSLNLAVLALSPLLKLADAEEDRSLRERALEMAHRSFLDARRSQVELNWLERDPLGIALLRGENRLVREMYVCDAWVLLQQGKLADAVVALEAGRAQAMAESQAIAGTSLAKLCEDHARRFSFARQDLLDARALGDRAAIRGARDRFIQVRQEVRTHCDADFLPGEPTFGEIIRAPRPDQALVYLATIDRGGFGLVIPPHRRVPQPLSLPQLTWYVVDDWLTRPDARGRYVGGYTFALKHQGLELLLLWLEYDADEGEIARRLSLPLQDLPSAAAPAFATLGKALDKIITTWRKEAEILAGDSSEQQQNTARMILARCTVPLGQALRVKEFRGPLVCDLRWSYLMVELEQVLEDLRFTCMEDVRRGLDDLGLSGVDQPIALIPCGKLSVLPLHAALVTERQGGEFLPFQETCELTYQASARALEGARKALEHLPKEPGPFLVFGDPQPTNEAELRWAKLEAESIAWLTERAGRSAGSPILGEEATLPRVLEELERVRLGNLGAWVTIASHGHADPSDPNKCYMLLANGRKLTLTELQRRQLLAGVREFNAEGCVTALGDTEHAPDELSSFAGGLLQAGAPCAIATQWSVSDRSAFLLMLRRVQYLLGNPTLSPARATQLAARWLRTATARELEELAKIGFEGIQPLGALRSISDTLRGVVEMTAPPEGLRWTAAEGFDQLGQLSRLQLHLETDDLYSHPFFWASTVVYGA
ncbi:MAG: CHAT domain-containing protein [Ktedonobacteraceae bacterium]